MKELTDFRKSQLKYNEIYKAQPKPKEIRLYKTPVAFMTSIIPALTKFTRL